MSWFLVSSSWNWFCSFSYFCWVCLGVFLRLLLLSRMPKVGDCHKDFPQGYISWKLCFSTNLGTIEYIHLLHSSPFKFHIFRWNILISSLNYSYKYFKKIQIWWIYLTRGHYDYKFHVILKLDLIYLFSIIVWYAWTYFKFILISMSCFN